MAKTNQSGEPERLRELLAERQRYETWLASIAIRRDSAPERVIDRIETDYKARLTGIRDELSARADELRDRIGVLSDQLAETRLREDARRDERAEAELRASTGELSPGQWAEISESADSAIAEYEATRQLIERDLSELERILSAITWSGTQGPPVAVPLTPSSADVTRTARAAAAVQPNVVGSSGGQAAAAKPSPSSSDVPADAQARPYRAPETQRRKDPSQRKGQEKTLLCGACGTANYPTERYCEACGAKLPSEVAN